MSALARMAFNLDAYADRFPPHRSKQIIDEYFAGFDHPDDVSIATDDCKQAFLGDYGRRETEDKEVNGDEELEAEFEAQMDLRRRAHEKFKANYPEQTTKDSSDLQDVSIVPQPPMEDHPGVANDLPLL